MSKLVDSVTISSVADLYTQFARFARSYELADNPLHGLTSHIPASAMFYAVVPMGESAMAETLMRRVAGRRKLREVRVHKDAIRHPGFVPTNHLVILYA